MKLRELILVSEDASAGATSSADIATVAYPLFVRGKTPKQKRKNARAAVGQKYVPGPKGIGTGVFENVDEGFWSGLKGNMKTVGYGQAFYVIPKFIDLQIQGLIKKNDPNPNFFSMLKKDIADLPEEVQHELNELVNDVDLEISHWPRGIFGGSKNTDVLRTKNLIATLKQIKNIVEKHDPTKEQDVEEAHVLNHDNVIYRLDRENPMSDTEVAVLGGAGRYSLKALRDKARREAGALAQDLSIEHGGAFRRSAENIKQLTNTINTIVAAYNELARLRRKGGRGSRGITDEDANFIRECIRVVEQATQNYRLIEGLTKEPDPQGYAKDVLTNPKFAIVVNTPGDLDWYKIGTYWNNKIVDPHEFGQDDSDTVMVAQGAEEYKQMLAKIKRMGLTYKIIGGTTDQPEIHDKP